MKIEGYVLEENGTAHTFTFQLAHCGVFQRKVFFISSSQVTPDLVLAGM